MNTTRFMNLVMGNVFNTQTTTPLPTRYYLGVSTTAPDIDGNNVTEPSSAAGYERVELTMLSAPVNGAIANTDSIAFDESTQNWGTVTHYVVYDAPTGGNLLMFGVVSPNRIVESGTVFMLRADDLTFTLLNQTV